MICILLYTTFYSLANYVAFQFHWMQWRIFASLELKKADKKLQRGKSRRGKSRASGDESLQQKDWKYEFTYNNQE